MVAISSNPPMRTAVRVQARKAEYEPMKSTNPQPTRPTRRVWTRVPRAATRIVAKVTKATCSVGVAVALPIMIGRKMIPSKINETWVTPKSRDNPQPGLSSTACRMRSESADKLMV